MAKTIEVEGLIIKLEEINGTDFISLTDIAKRASEGKPSHTIQNWMKNTNTLRYLITWEKVHNPKLKVTHLDDLLVKATDNRFIISPQKWIEKTGAVGILQKVGRNGGTFAHSEIALDFCYWLSPEFKVYLNKEFLRLKEEESNRTNLEWHISKITDYVDNTRILLDSIPFQKSENRRISFEEEE